MAKRQKILILTSGPLCRNPRALKEAWTLGETGYGVTVITIANDDRFEAIDRGLLENAPFTKVPIDLRATTASSRAAGLFQRVKTSSARRAVRWGIQSPNSFGPYRPMLRVARAHPADLTIAHTEVALCVAAALAGDGRRVAADFEDWHSEDLLPSARAGRPLRLLREIELNLLRHAAYTTTTSECLATELQKMSGGRRPIVLTNSFPLQPAPPPRDPTRPVALVWFSQTIGPGRGLEMFLDAWSLSSAASRLKLVGDLATGYAESLVARISSARRKDLEFVPLLTPAKLPPFLAVHDIGLALEATTPRSRDLTITNKILQYLNAGLAIIATPTAGQKEVLSRAPGAGLSANLDSPSQFARELDGLLRDRPALSAMGRSGRRAAESIYCWEKESPRLVETVEWALQLSASVTASQ